MSISRRFFIGGLASAAALGPRGLFAAAPGAFADGKPKLAFGVLSDVHIALAKGGRKQTPSRSTKYLEKALAHFRDNGVHAVVIAGDITNDGVFGELKAVADAWYRVFPNDKAPDGHKVERIFVFGNHDWSGIRRGSAVYDDEATVMPAFNRFEAKQGQLVRVYADRIVLSRRDFFNDVPLENDLVLPLPAAESKPFAFATRSAAARPPAFHPGVALAFRLTEAKVRGAKKSEAPKKCVEIAIPPATAGGRCVRYEIVTKGADGKELKIALLAEGFRFAASDKRVQAPAKCRIALDRLASDEVPFSVVAYSTWGKASEPLNGTFGAFF